jgi:CubicO group peptidase (beta-lactamase class C family)
MSFGGLSPARFDRLAGVMRGAVDPAEEMVAILMMQRMMTRPDDDRIKRDFLTLAYQAIDD